MVREPPPPQAETLESLWKRNSALWCLLASPVRPSPEDVGLYQKALRAWSDACSKPRLRILLLGVTQELRGMAWPADAELVSCDHSWPMIDALWPATVFAGALACPTCADWQAMPFRTGSRNIALGDGWASMVSPEILRRSTRELHRVLEPQGMLVSRLYLLPHDIEQPENVAAAAAAGEIGSFHAFKWRLAMAVQGRSGFGVRLADIWDTFTALLPDRQLLSGQSGWPVESIGTIDSYRGAQGRYYYHSLDTYAELLQPAFEIMSVDYPGYELGERCPVITAIRR